MPEPAAQDEAQVDRRIVSVLFADIVGFTPLSEQLDAEDVAMVQDAYFSTVRDTIARYGGVVEKFIGDAVMAVFGAPRARDDDAERATRAGLALQSAIEHIAARLGLPEGALQLRVGVNTGEVVHATGGPDAGRVTGDTVNTAARLQTAARPGTVLVGELTHLAVAEQIETRSIGTVELKGKAAPMRAWEAVAVRPQPSRDEALGALRAPTLGREEELARLLAMERGRCLIVAPPGVGKSRLLAELAAHSPATILRARVRPQGTAPFETVAQLFESAGGDLHQALAQANVPAARAEVIEEAVRQLTASSAGRADATGDLAGERDARFDAWLEAFDALTASAGAPSVWLVEDVHWAGGDLLAFLERAGQGDRLVVATARPSLLEAAPAWCASAERLDLAPLPPTDAADLVRALVGDALPPELVATVAERSDGTPLFIEELLRTWASVGILRHDGGSWSLAVAPDAVTLPPTVQAIYAAQLDDLPPDARMVARRGAVAGRRIPRAALEPLELGDFDAGLDALRRRAFVEGPLDDPITGDEYAYRHALLRDAGYASLARAERARLHEAMARWLAATAGDGADVVAEGVAEHYAAALDALPALGGAGLRDRTELAADAAAWYERAGQAALRLSAVDAARRHFARAVELTPETAPLDAARRRLRRGEVLAASAELDVGIGEIEAARATFADHLPAAAPEYERASYALGRAFMQQIRFPETTSVCSEALDALTGTLSESALSRLHALRAWSIAAMGVADGVLAEAEAARAAAEGGDPLVELDVLEHVGAARGELGAADEEVWEALEARATALGRWSTAVTAGRVRAAREADTDPRATLGRLDPIVELAATHGLTEQRAWCEYARCETLWLLGDWDAAMAAGLRALDVAERYAYERVAFRTWVVVLQVAAQRRDAELIERYDAWWAEAAPHFPPSPSPYGRLLTGAIAVWRAQARGEPVTPPPDELLDAVTPMTNAHFIGAIEAVIRAWLDAGRSDLATAASVRLAEAAADDEATTLMRASAALVDAWITGSSDSATRAATLAASVPAPWWESRAREAVAV